MSWGTIIHPATHISTPTHGLRGLYETHKETEVEKRKSEKKKEMETLLLC